MQFLKSSLSCSQIKALLRKDFLVRWRQKWLTAVQILWPCIIFLLPYLIRLKYMPVPHEACQFPTRQLPTTRNTLPGFLSNICSIENKCSNTENYEEYTALEQAPMKPIIDIVQILINEDRMFTALVELPEKANFVSAVTTLVTNSHFDEIRKNIEKVIALVPEVEKSLNGSFDIKKLFSDRQTFVKAGNLLCGFPFPNTETIPLVEDILYTKDFSEANQDELNTMPTDYCKRLYLDVTSTNYGKITWQTIKPIIQGKILYAPNTLDTDSIIKFANSTFEELNRLKMISVALEQILTKLRHDEVFQDGFDRLIRLAQTPFVRSIIGDEFDMDEIESIMQRIRTDPIIYDVITTVKNILECLSVDRFQPFDTESELRRKAFELNQKRIFYAAVYFNETETENVSYKFHMDTQNTQPTIENKNRFWFPGPAGSMLLDMKYHRGFVQIKHSLDMGIIKHKKEKLRKQGLLIEETVATTPKNSFSIKVVTDDDEDATGNTTLENDEDDDDWFTDDENYNSSITKPTLIAQMGRGFPNLYNITNLLATTADDNAFNDSTSPFPQDVETAESITFYPYLNDSSAEPDDLSSSVLKRSKRQNFLDFLMGFTDDSDGSMKYAVDDLEFYTKQFPYPAYTQDDFKTGIYLAQAIQCAFFLGLVAEIASCVRHLIWMRESKNSMIMRSMGLKACSELTSWCLITFLELLIIFISCSIILYTGGMVVYAKWLFTMIYLSIFGACLIAFCYMCATFFTSATIGAVATAVLFFISFCPYIIVLLFDAQLNSLQNFIINLSFTTAFAHGWSHIMRLELQEIGLSFERVFEEGLRGEYGFSLFMIVFDLCLYSFIGYVHQRFKDDEFRFTEVQREDLDSSIGATLTNVTKTYDGNKIAVSDISLSFPKNQVTCLLGRNGAGKSTIIKMLTGQVVQTTGRVILSQAMSNCSEYDKIGVCGQDNILIPNLTAREHLELYAKIKLRHGYESEVNKTLKNLNFGKHESYQASQLSGGYQRRLCVAIAFIGSPNVVIMDEPCNGVDNKARKDIWELIERLRKGRAVIFATHFLDEAEHLSDVIVIMKNGKIIAKHNPETLKNHCTAYYEVQMNCCDTHTSTEIMEKAKKLLTNFKEMNKSSNTDLKLRISYDQQNESSTEYLKYLENLQLEGKIKDLSLESENLEHVFKNLDKSANGMVPPNGYSIDMLNNVKSKKDYGWNMVRETPLTRCEAIHQLFWKRLVHFSRNYRMLLCVIVLPALFEICAMWFVAQRLEDDYDKTLKLSRALYPKSTQMLSMQEPLTLTQNTYDNMLEDCSTAKPCKEFHNSERAFYWILETLNDYQEKRYGGYSFNDTKSIVWYNNKGYHAMVSWLNDMNSYLLQIETNNTNYKITAYNEPWELGYMELSTTSILRQAGDSCMAFILLIAFSMVVAVASVYLVNERVKGEKLQQKLCGVDALTYWGVAFVWDFLIMILAILVCSIIILAFGMPVFTDRQQLWGLIALGLFFAFACIPAVHVFEKCFSDSSVAIVTIFILNVIIPLFTMSVIVVLGVVGDSATWDEWRYFLNHRLFLIFPQHALGDGLLEICKNYMVALVFKRYDVDSYKNPLNSDLLKPHFIALTILGLLFLFINILIESGLWYQCKDYIARFLNIFPDSDNKPVEELKIVSIQNSLKDCAKVDCQPALKVEHLSKSYGKQQYAVNNITFTVKTGECFGLLGKNGAGKSTIFKMLSGQLQPTNGHIVYENREISYCPQTNTLDSLLTVKECIEFYARLRRIRNIDQLVANILESFHLEPYRDVLVKNLSGGNRRKLTVATSCCGRTSVVLMDEPTSDMDPVTRALVYRTIDDLLAEKRAIILTSHSISEIDKICHQIAVLKEGQMLTCNSPENLKSQYGGYYNVTIYCDQNIINNLEKEIRRKFLNCKDLQIYAHSVKFSVKIDKPSYYQKSKKNGTDTCEDLPHHNELITAPVATSITKVSTLSELFHELHDLSQQISGTIRYAVNNCKLDAVFERILDSSETQIKANGYREQTVAAEAPALQGYVHNGYVETETVT